MKTPVTTLLLVLSLMLFAACSTDKFDSMSDTEAIALIESQEESLFDAMGQHSDSVSRSVLGLYDKFAAKFPAHELTPEYLSRAGNISRSLKDYDMAISKYQTIVDKYPDFEKVTEAHFLIAFIYDNDLKQKEKAKAVYQKIADTRGDHVFAKQAKERLETIHLSDKELIERFKRQNAEKAASAAEVE